MKSPYRLYAVLALALLLTACKVSKDIARPLDTVPDTYRLSEATDSSTIAALTWKQFFTDAPLQQLIDSSLSRNYDLQLAVKSIESAQLVLKQSKLGYLPEAAVQATGSISRPSDNSLNGLSLSQFLGRSYVENYTLSAVLSWEADIWGKIKNRKAAALAQYLQTREARKAVQTELVAAVANGYYNLLMLDAQVAIARKNILLGDSTVTMTKLQYQAGEVTSLAVQQATAQRLAAAKLVPQLEQEILIQENALSVLSGIAPGGIARSQDLNSIPAGNNATGLPAALLQYRPDVKQKELAIAIANANTGIAKAQMYPSLNITAEGGINSFLASNWFNLPASLFAAAAGSLAQPLFTRGRLKTSYQLTLVEREETVIEFRQTVLSAVGEVSDALARTSKLSAQQAIAAEQVLTLQQATGNAVLLFRNGMANYLEVITAQANVLQAELDLSVLKKQQLSAGVSLYRALGGGTDF